MAEDCRRKWTTHEGVTAHAPRAGTVVGLQNPPHGVCVHPGLSSIASRCFGKGNVVHVISILSLSVCLPVALCFLSFFLPLYSTVQYDTVQNNLIAKYQYNCTWNVLWCQVRSSHIHANNKTSLYYNNNNNNSSNDNNNNNKGGKKSLINKYMRNLTDIKVAHNDNNTDISVTLFPAERAQRVHIITSNYLFTRSAS